MELEKRIDKNSYSYELKLIDDEDYETYLVNCNLNGKETPHSGSSFSFLVYFARSIDERITLEDVYDYLGISKYYNRDEDNEIVLPNGDFFDDILLSGRSKDFKKYVENMINYINSYDGENLALENKRIYD